MGLSIAAVLWIVCIMSLLCSVWYSWFFIKNESHPFYLAFVFASMLNFCYCVVKLVEIYGA